MTPMFRFFTALGVLAFTWLAGAGTAGEPDLLETSLRVEERLLAADLQAYAAGERRQREAWARLEEVRARLDDRLQARDATLRELEELEARLAAAWEGAQTAAMETAELRRRIYERMRRMRILQEEILAVRSRVEPKDDPISGRWRVEVNPGGATGVFHLQLHGALVQGSYEMDGGGRGSLRGTYVAGTLRLDRIDAQRGFDSIFEGRVDGSRGEIVGFWQPTLLSPGGVAGGEWTAFKMANEKGEESESG